MARPDQPRASSILRLLRLLGARETKHVRLGADLVIHYRGQEHRFEAKLLHHCQSTGLIDLARQTATLRAEGEAYLRRAMYPEAGYGAQHGILTQKIIEPGKPPVLENLGESPLARLFLRRDANGKTFIDSAALAAGERFRNDFEKAGLQPRISANWEASLASRGHASADNGISDFALDARRRVDRALGMLGTDLAGVATDVCCFLKGLETVERERRWPPRSAKLMLRTALNLLAAHYGITGSGNSSAPMQHWGTADYRPGIAGASG